MTVAWKGVDDVWQWLMLTMLSAADMIWRVIYILSEIQ